MSASGLVLIVGAVVGMVALWAAAAEGPAAGVYRGEGLTLELKRQGNACTGTVKLGEKTFPVEGTVDPLGAIRGTFTADGQKFEWTAKARAGGVTFSTGGSDYQLAGEGAPAAANPLARKAPSTQPGAAVGAPAPAGALKLKRVAVRDPGINNIEAISFLVPDGWKTDARIQWFPDLSVLAMLLAKVTDGQTGAEIETLPIQNFTWLSNPVMPMQPGMNYMGNIVCQPVQDPRQFIQMFYVSGALAHLREAKVVTVEELPKVAQQVAKDYEGIPANVTSARVRYAYERGGKPWEEDVYVTLVFTQFQLGVIWQCTSAYSFRAPGGQLDKVAPLMTTVVQTARMNPEWFGGYAYVQKLFMQRMQQGIRNAAAISETISRNSEEIRQMITEGYQKRCESQDRISQSVSESIRGVETYKNPFEDRAVQLPSGYKDAWVNGSGEYILSDVAGFDPNVGDNREWRRMEAGR